jgi:hypothetical protein
MSQSMRDRLGRIVRYATMGGALVTALEFARTRALLSGSAVETLQWLAILFTHWTIASLAFATALAWLDRHDDGAVAPSATYFVAWIVGVGGGVALLTLHHTIFGTGISRRAVGFDMPWHDVALNAVWPLAFWGALACCVHASRARRALGDTRLHEAQIARLAAEQRLAELELGSLRAQIEPQFMLAAVKSLEPLYAENRVVADRALDALIEFLRTSLQRLRQPVGTVADECALAWRYATGVLAALDGPGRVTLSVTMDAADVPLPPGTLLSFVQPMLAEADASATLEIGAVRSWGGVCLRLRGDGFCATSREWTATLTELEERLVRVFGTGAQVRASPPGPAAREVELLLSDVRSAATAPAAFPNPRFHAMGG